MKLEVGFLVESFITDSALELDFFLVISFNMISQLTFPVKL